MDLAASRSRARSAIASIALAGLATAAVLAPAPSSAAAADEAKMGVRFTAPVAKVAGPGALVPVKCVGSAARECVGTLSLEVTGVVHEVAYSIGSGEKQVVVVPLGADQDLVGGIVSPSARAVAETLQATGSSARTTRVLRFR